MRKCVLATCLLAASALCAAAEDFEVLALVDSLDFAMFYDIETSKGTINTLEHVLRSYPTTVLWRDKGGGLMRYPSDEELSEYVENPLDKRQIWRRSIYGDLRQHNRATNVFQLVKAECDRRKIGFGIHTGWEENHSLAGTESNWTMAHPGLTSRSRLGPVRLAAGSLAYPECLEHKLAMVDERLALRPQTIFLDLFRAGGWSPLFEYTEPVLKRWRELYDCEPPTNGRTDARWNQLVSEYTHDYLRKFSAKCHARNARLVLGVSAFDKDEETGGKVNDYCWRERAIDWRALAREGVLDGVVIMGTPISKPVSFETAAAQLAYAKASCGKAKLYFQVSSYVMNTGYATYATAEGVSQPEAAQRMIEIAKEAGCSGVILECVDYNNYADAICDVLGDASPVAAYPIFRWTGAATGDWSASANWSRAEAPNAVTNTVEFRRSATVALASTNDVANVIVRNPGSQVVLASAAGGALRITLGDTPITDDRNGITVGAEARLTLKTPVLLNGRFDRWGYGELYVGATMAGNDIIFSSFGTNVVARGGCLLATGGNVLVGNGSGEEAHGCLRLEEDGRVEARTVNMAGGVACAPNVVVQDGDETSVHAVAMNLNTLSKVGRQTYMLRRGTLAATTLTTSGSDAVAGGEFLQEGGVSEFGVVNVVHGGVRVEGGRMKVTSKVTATSDAEPFVVAGGELELAAGAQVAAPLVVSNATLALDGAVVCSDAGRFVLAGDVTVRLNGDATLDGVRWEQRPGTRLTLVANAPRILSVPSSWVLPDALEIGANVTVQVALGAQLTARSIVPPAVAIRSGGHLNLAGQTAYIATPIDLSIETGGQLWVDSEPGRYARTMVVAHRYAIDGVERPIGKYPAENAEKALFRGNTSSTLQVPYTWTGAGDGTRWSDAANWEGNAVPPGTRNFVADFSRAAGPVVLSNADLGGVAYLPPTDSVLTLRGETDKSWFQLFGEQSDYRPVAFCRRGCRIDFDIDFRNGRGEGVNAWNGEGTFRFLRSATGVSDRYFNLAGEVQLAGALAGGNLSFFSNHDSSSKVRILDGADVSLGGTITTEVFGFLCGRGYEQEGGSVAAKCLCLSVGRPDGRTYANYVLRGGSLTLSEALILGGTNPLKLNAGGMYDTGDFTMTGGTLTTPLMSTELNSNWYRLSGGDVWLGAGGIVRTRSERARSADNVTPGLEFGGVTFHATESWTSVAELDVALMGEGGNTAFDLAAERTVTLAGAVSGPGGLVKRGEGTLVLGGAYSATGPIRAEGGRLVFAPGSTLSGVRELDVRGACVELKGAVENQALVLRADALDDISVAGDVTVGALVLDGAAKRPGVYEVAGGTLTVAVPEGEYAWVGAEGGRWTDGANWAGGRIPNGADVSLDLIYSQLPEQALLIVDGPVALGGLDCSTATGAGQVVLRGAGALTLSDGATLTVPEGCTLVVECEVRAKGEIVKRGAGKVVFAKRLTSSAAPETLVFGQGGRMRVAEGEAEITGEVEGVHVFPCSRDAAAVPLVTIGEGAVLTNCALVTGTWCPQSGAAYGRVVQNGGRVVIGKAALGLFGSTGIQGASYGHANKHCFAWFERGESSYALNGGVYEFAVAGAIFCMNLNNTNSGGGRNTVTVNGGRMTLGTRVFFSTQNEERDELTLNGGELFAECLDAGSGSGDRCVRLVTLNGGAFTHGAESASDKIEFSVTGETSVVQPSADASFVLPATLTGTGRLVQRGPGTLVVGSTPFAGDFLVEGGVLAFADGAVLSAANKVIATGGAVRFLGAADVASILLDVPTLDDVSAAGGREIAIRRLCLDGVSQTVGRYPVVGGILSVLKDGCEEVAVAANAPELDWYMSGDREWFGEWSATAADGEHAARSGAIGHGEESVLGVRFYGKGTFAFDWRTSSETKYDAVRLEVDGTVVRHLSGETDWQRVSLDLGPGWHDVRWQYLKNRSVSVGDDAAWVDRVTWTTAPVPTLSAALNHGCELEWRTGGDADWEAYDTSAAYEGGSCAVSGAIGDWGETWLETTVSGAGRLEFVWAASCERYDWCELWIDGAFVSEISGTTDWIARSIDLDEGDHVVRWVYWKDGSDDPDEVGADCILLDYVRWTPAADVIDTDFGTVDVSEFYAWLKEHRQVEEPSVPLTREARQALTEAKASSPGLKGMSLAAEFVAGTDPEDETSEFTASVEMVDGSPVIRWTPALNGVDEDGRCVRDGIRLYTLLGSTDLVNWEEVPAQKEADYRFFKVKVELP